METEKMFKKILFFLVIVLLTIATSAPCYQYKDYKWGMSREEVKNKLNKDGANFLGNGISELIKTKDIVMGQKAIVMYRFGKGKIGLYSVGIAWWEQKEVSFFERVKEVLTAKYKSPTSCVGTLNLYCMWAAKDTKSTIMLGKDIGEEVVLLYIDIERSKQEEDDKKKRDIKKFKDDL